MTPNKGEADLWFLCTALLLIEIYLHTRFLVDISCSYRVRSRTSLMWTGGRTDGQTGGHKNGKCGGYLLLYNHKLGLIQINTE